MHELVDKSYQIPYPSVGIESLFERLKYIHTQESLDVVIPNFDAELFSFIRLAPELKKMGVHTFLPTDQQFEERQKTNLPAFGKKYNIHVPESETIFSADKIAATLKNFDYPIVVKGKYYDASIAYNLEQVTTAFHRISSKWGLPIIIQEFIKGTEYNVVGLGDGNGNTVAAVPMRKQYITDKGKAWGGIAITDEKLLEMTKRFVKETKWRGGFELELMKNSKNEYYLMEINPRIPAWVYLAVGVGQNIPEALTLLALGDDVKPYTSYEHGKMFIRYSWDMIVDLKEFEKISTTGEL
jgi:carbamoyl-phosphate synthase large subunit